MRVCVFNKDLPVQKSGASRGFVSSFGRCVTQQRAAVRRRRMPSFRRSLVRCGAVFLGRAQLVDRSLQEELDHVKYRRDIVASDRIVSTCQLFPEVVCEFAESCLNCLSEGG